MASDGFLNSSILAKRQTPVFPENTLVAAWPAVLIQTPHGYAWLKHRIRGYRKRECRFLLSKRPVSPTNKGWAHHSPIR
jgi:hypothetical protein